MAIGLYEFVGLMHSRQKSNGINTISRYSAFPG